MNKQPYRLGIDMGTNSLGWCLLSLDSSQSPTGLLDWGVRIFSDGRVPKSGEPLAVARRIARGTRRRRDRYIRRRHVLMNRLIVLKLMPEDQTERKALENGINPYCVRAQALDRQLTHFELGRALFHLNQRRGFKSNRKTASKEEKSKIGEDLQGLRDAISNSFSRTLGEFLWQRHKNSQLVRARTGEKLYPTRALYEAEFDEIRKVQSPHYPQIKASDWDLLRETIFYQRDLKSPEPGYCRFMDGEHRSPRALPCFQKFSIAQDLANLLLINPDRTKVPLNNGQRELLWKIFNRQESVAFGKIRKTLKLSDEIKFNLESDKREKLHGNATAKLLADKKYFGDKWYGLGDEKQNEIVAFLLEVEDEEEVMRKAKSEWDLSEEQARNLAELTPDNFPKGYARFSRTALQKLWPPMLEQGLTLDKAAGLYGWSHSDTYTDELLPKLPYYGEVLQESVVGANPNFKGELKTRADEAKRWGRITNPTVHIGLNQLSLVVNAVIDRYGSPTEIVIELARDLKLNKKQKDALGKEQLANQKRNESIAQKLAELKVEDNTRNRDIYKLWEELNPKDCLDRKCPFSGTTISANMIFSDQVEIEHILPRAKTIDDSLSNKTLALREANRLKAKRSPYEAFCHDSSPYNYGEILDRTKDMPGNKRWRFEPDAMERFEDEDAFLSRQLNDTQYLSKVAKKYLSYICPHNKVWAIPGRLTALLRRKLIKFKKNRNDHRHHAVDALITALTSRKFLHDVSRLSSQDTRERIMPPEPWERFQSDVLSRYECIVISHRPDHSISGRLHEDSNYGILEKPTPWEKEQGYNLVCRKTVEGLTDGGVDAVRDPDLRRKLLETIHQIDNKKALQKRLADFSAKSRIRGVRVLKKDKTVVPIHHPAKKPIHKRGVIPGEVHHIAFWRLPDGTIEPKGLSLFEANQKQKKDLRPHPAAKLVLKLHKKDIVRLEIESVLKTVRVVSVSPVNKTVRFAELYDAGETDEGYFKKSFSTFKEIKMRKIYVDLLGRIKDPGDVLW